jgi:TolB-like protein
MNGLLARARERKLDSVGATYAVTAWVIVQASSTAVSAFELPGASMRWLLIVLFMGFPLALGWAWITNRNRDVETAGESDPVHLRDWLPFGVAAIVAVVLGIGSATGIFSKHTAPKTVAAVQSEPSVAVLPFENLSGDPSKTYFSDGIADQLINELSRIPPLRVAARTSSFSFRGKNADAKTIGRELSVRNLLEGSVREDGKRVRIAAELVDATNGFQVWSDTYDRDLTGILALQDDIAGAIAVALRKRLGGKAASVPHKTPRPKAIDPEAYKAFLQGQYYFAQDTEESVKRAIEFFTQATTLAPDYAEGFAALANAESYYALDYTHPANVPAAVAAMKKTLSLDPANPIALVTRVRLSLSRWQWRNAAADIKRLQDLHANSAAAWRIRASFFDYMALPDLGLAAEQKAAQLDPLSITAQRNLVLFWIRAKDYAKAKQAATAAAPLQPGDTDLQMMQCEIAAGENRLEDARRILQDLSARTGGDAAAMAGICNFQIAIAKNDLLAARKIANTFGADAFSPGYIGSFHQAAGNIDSAVMWYRRGFAQRDPEILMEPYSTPNADKLFADPRWKALRKEPAIREWEAKRAEIAREFQSSAKT